MITLWQTNIAMENGPFEDEFPIDNFILSYIVMINYFDI